mgnify:CR=1 FL=1
MKWSQFNFIFKSEKYGPLLYNSYSNIFISLTEEDHEIIIKSIKDNDMSNFNKRPNLAINFLRSKVLIEDHVDQIKELRLRQEITKFSNLPLSLTIAPTTECNFECTYCYEESRLPIYMEDKTEDALIDFIKSYGKIPYLYITWYGGEPLMAFDRIESITKRILDEKIPLYASIVTNGYLLDKNIISKLKQNRIRKIQITVDGLEKQHNTTRPLIGGGDTFNKILQNIDTLLKDWDGKLSIRVNISKNNDKDYHKIYKFLHDNYKDYDNFHVYPGIVQNVNACSSVGSCAFDRDHMSNFLIDQYQKHKIKDVQLFPTYNSGVCIANNLRGYVLGPEGNLFKCWNDIGRKEMIVGNIFKRTGWNNTLLAEYMCGLSPFEDDDCKKCKLLPICMGGCLSVALKHKNGQKNIDKCSFFKGRIKEFLEITYSMKK